MREMAEIKKEIEEVRKNLDEAVILNSLEDKRQFLSEKADQLIAEYVVRQTQA